jgi:hypothetical protein
MDLTAEQLQKITCMLGTPVVTWSRTGALFFSQRMPDMDALVESGALRVQETIEPWGPTVTYIVTNAMRRRMAAVMLGES